MIRISLILALFCTGRSTLAGTQLGVEGSRFTVNGKPNFLLGVSYYGGLGAPRESIEQDLDDMQRLGFNWIRVWATEWQYHFVRFIHEVEKNKPKQHPVWMSFQWDGIAGPGNNQNLWKSPAEAVSPAHDDNKRGAHPYRSDPPATNAGKVVLSNTDHIWGVGGDVAWVWKSFTRGLQPIFMEPYKDSIWNSSRTIEPKWDPVRRAMGHTRAFANKMNLAAMTPQNKLASTEYCLANPGEEYLVYLPDGGKLTVDLLGAKGVLSCEWFNPSSGKATTAGMVSGGARPELKAPFDGAAVLHLLRSKGK